MTSEQVRLHRTDLCLIKEWLPAGDTASGIRLAHHESLPRIFADVVLAPRDAPVKAGDFIVFPRYAGEPADFDDGRFWFLNLDDIEAVADFRDGVL